MMPLLDTFRIQLQRSIPLFLLIWFSLTCLSAAIAQQTARQPETPIVAEQSGEADLAQAAVRFPTGLTIQLFAAEPKIANPVAIDVDAAGRVFVCETFRQEQGVEDNREHPEWLDEDLAAQSVADRIRYIRRHEPDVDQEYRSQDDRIRLILDNDGDGSADQSLVYSSGYNGIEEGTGAGVLAIGNDVYYTNIPNLWKLTDTNADGIADVKQSLHHGFGVRFAFRGHDLHGLVLGPDQRLYFSIGDRGYNVSPNVKDPAAGAVFSCELDGSDLQVFATGLRNPQELAFDDFGNLFTGDNNSDSGDRARWVYVVPGGDSGWRMYYQYLPDRGPFNREQIWQPFSEQTPAYIVPPIANFADGPSGLAFDPGTGLTDHFRQRFLLCDFRGSASVSGIRSFRLKNQGAGFEIIDAEKTIWNSLATDVCFGADGKLYVADWVTGWRGVGKGRIFSFQSDDESTNIVSKQVQTILRDGVKKIADSKLVNLLAHADRRVRYAAQFELVAREKASELLHAFLKPGEDNVLSALHGLWGFTQLAKKFRLPQLLSVEDQSALKLWMFECERQPEEIRAQFAKTIGLAPNLNYANALQIFIEDKSDRVRFMAGLSIGSVGDTRHLPSLLKMAADNADQDPFLRHAAIMGLKGIIERVPANQKETLLLTLANHSSSSVRLATVVALRKLKDSFLSRFLEDADERIVLESARAVHDLPLGLQEMSALAKLIERPSKPDALTRRILNANFIVGAEANAAAIAEFALNRNENLERRRDALKLMQTWRNPSPKDFVLGDWRPLADQRNGLAVDHALQKRVDAALGDLEIAEGFISACLANRIPLPPQRLATFIRSNEAPPLQMVSLLALQKQDVKMAKEILLDAMQTPANFPLAWFQFLGQLEAESVIEFAQIAINSQDIDRGRAAIELLAGLANNERAQQLITSLLSQIKSGTLAKEHQLDVMLVARDIQNDAVENAMKEIVSTGSSIEIPYHFAAHGGDANRGRSVFRRTELSCLRCHSVSGGGGAVGPDLSTIGRVRNREEIIQSIVYPNKVIAEGFNEIIILTDIGEIVTGVKKSETDTSTKLVNKDGEVVEVLKDEIEEQKIGQSSMPADLIKKMSLRDLRDLVEYLASQKSAPTSH